MRNSLLTNDATLAGRRHQLHMGRKERENCSSTHHTAAFKFALSLDGFKTTRHCHVVWRNGNTCGVKFVDQGGARV